jgi:hypothetical protein
MKILLINNNPVVSRLTALSARKEDIEIDEIQEVTELNNDNYDIVFVDGDSWSKDVKDVITENMKVEKAVLFYSEGDEDEKESFDLTILKPFLPSEVSAVIRAVEELQDSKDETLTVKENNFDILADAEESKREELFDLDEKEEEKIVAEIKEDSTEEILFGSLEEEKSSLALDDMPKEESFDKKLDEAFPLKINSLEDELFEDEKENLLDMKKEEELFDLDLDVNDQHLSLEDELFSKEKEVPADSVLDFDLEEDEIKLDDENETLAESEEETKILDKSEIDNIKEILNENSSDEMSLEDLMPIAPLAAVAAVVSTTKGSDENIDEVLKASTEEEETSSETKEAKIEDKIDVDDKAEESRDEKVETNTTGVEANVLFETLKTLPIENLRELLAGAKIDISIRFPKAK